MLILVTSAGEGVGRKERPVTLAEIGAAGRSRFAAEEAERARISAENQAAFLKKFRADIANDDCFTDGEKADIISELFVVDYPK